MEVERAAVSELLTVLAKKGKQEIPRPPAHTADPGQCLKGAESGHSLSQTSTSSLPINMHTPLSCACDLLSASQEAKYQTAERESGRCEATHLSYILCRSSFCTSSKSCLVRSSIFPVKRQRFLKQVCTPLTGLLPILFKEM